MEWGDKLDTLLKFEAESGITPKALQDRPELPADYTWFFQEYNELCRDRRYDQGTPLPLTTSDIHKYWSAFGFLDFPGFYETMVKLDRAHMGEVTKKQKAEAEKAKSKKNVAPKPSRRR